MQEAADAPRFYHVGSSDPNGHPAKGGGMVGLESGIGTDVRRALAGLLVEQPAA